MNGSSNNMSEFKRFEKELQRCRMTPDNINAYVNAACSLAGMLEMLMLDIREQLKAAGRYRHLCKMNVNKILDRCTLVVDNSERCTDERTWEMHAKDIAVFHQLFVRDGMTLNTKVRLVEETSLLAIELLDNVINALDAVDISSPIARHVRGKLLGISSLTKGMYTIKDHQVQWESMPEDLRNIFRELMANRPKEEATI